MSELPASSTPNRQAIVRRLQERIECFRKHHDNCQARLDETRPSREQKEREQAKVLHVKSIENKDKMNPKSRNEHVSKISKQGVNNVGPEKLTTNTAGQSMKRRGDSPQGERNSTSTESPGSLVSQIKYPRFNSSKAKPSNFTAGSGETLPLQPFPTVNGHNGEFPNSEELSKPVVSSYSGPTCENIDRIIRVSPNYMSNFTSSPFANRSQPSVSDNTRTPDYTVDFKQENGLLNSEVERPTSITNGFLNTCTKSEGEFGGLLTDYVENPNSKSKKDEDLKTQISQFELVLQGIKNRDGNFSDSESKKDVATSKQPLNPQSLSLVNGLSDSVSHEGAKGSNQLSLSNGNGPNNAVRLPTVAVTSSTHQQHGILPSTAEALQQFVRAQKEERLATKASFERPLFLNPQGVGREQNPTGMPPRPNTFPIRPILYEQIQQRRTNQQRAKIHGSQTSQLHARNPAMNPLAATSPYQMHPKVRYQSLSPTTRQPVSSFTSNARIQQNLMPQVHHPSAVQQQQPQAQLQNMPQHQISMYAQQRIAFQRQMVNRLPSYSQTQHMPPSMMDVRKKYPAGVHTSHTAQYPMQQPATRNPQPLSHLQHYPNAYSGHSGPPTRPLQPPFMGEHSGYQHPYTNTVSQDNKMHSGYQRITSLDDTCNLAVSRYHNQDGRSYPYQRSSSLPSHTGVVKNVFNQTSPPVVRLEQTKPNLPDMNNNGNEQQELSHIHPQPQHPVQQPPLTHLKQQQVSQTNNLNINQELYQASGLVNRSRSQTTANLQQTFSNPLSNLESPLFPFIGQEASGENIDNTDFDSLLKSPPSDFNLLHILEGEPQKELQ